MPKHPKQRMTCRSCGRDVDVNGPDGVALVFRNSKDGKRTVIAAFCNEHVPEKPELVPFPELDDAD